jgi:capsular polysaccharide biosynthesis protein
MTTYFENKLEKTTEITTYEQDTVLHLLHPFSRYIYGHLYDTLQKLYIVEKENLSFNSILLPKTNEIVEFDIHIKALNLQKYNMIKSDDGLIKIKNLLFIMPLVHPTTFIHESYLYIRNAYHRYFNLSASVPADKKIFLTRRPEVFKRSLLNDREMEVALTSNGISYLDGSEPLKEIVQLLGRASHIAGVHGSLFVNNIFAHAHANYVEYCPSTRVDRNFYNQYKFCDSYQHVIIDAEPDHNLKLDIDSVLEFYLSLIIMFYIL